MIGHSEQTNRWNGSGQDAPTLFSAPRWTFPYSLVARPFRDLGRVSADAVRPDWVLSRAHGVQIRPEFFGALAFKHASLDEGPYGHKSYLNKLGTELLVACDGGVRVADLPAKVAARTGVTLDESTIREYVGRLASAGLVAVGGLPAAQPSVAPAADLDRTPWSSAQRMLSAPLRLYLNLTKRCNLRCKHCYADAGGKHADHDLEMVDRVLHEAQSLKIPTIALIGGEPLLYKGILDVVRKSNGLGLTTVMTTNGVAVTQERAAAMKAAGMKILTISVDGAREEDHDFIRGAGSFRKAVAGMESCRKAGLDVCVSTTLTARTIGTARELIRFGIEHGAMDFQLMLFSPVGRGLEGGTLVPSDDQARRLRDELLACYDEFKGVTINCTGAMIPDVLGEWISRFQHDPIASFVYTGCEAARFRCEVGFDGHIIPCVLLDSDEFRAGHVSRTSIADAWRKSPQFEALRRPLKPAAASACTRCAGYGACRGGCRGVKYARYGDLSEAYPTCAVRA